MKNFIILLLCAFSVNAFSETIKVGYLKGSTLADIKSEIVYGDEVDVIRSSITGNIVTFVEYATASSLLEDTKVGRIDVGIGGLSMTPERVDHGYNFSVPTSINEITVCYDTGNTDNTSVLTGKIYNVVKTSLKQLLVILTIFAHLIWVVERYNKDDSNFHKNYFIGICDAYWWSLVTSSTVGYGDLVPKTIIGRILGGLIIICGVTWFGLYIGSISAAYDEISNGCTMVVGVDLHKPITKSGSTTCKILDDLHIDYITFETLDECMKALSDGTGDCVVFDKNKLEKYVNRNDKLKITKQVFKKEYVGITYRDGFEYADAINKTIVMKFSEK